MYYLHVYYHSANTILVWTQHTFVWTTCFGLLLPSSSTQSPFLLSAISPYSGQCLHITPCKQWLYTNYFLKSLYSHTTEVNSTLCSSVLHLDKYKIPFTASKMNVVGKWSSGRTQAQWRDQVSEDIQQRVGKGWTKIQEWLRKNREQFRRPYHEIIHHGGKINGWHFYIYIYKKKHKNKNCCYPLTNCEWGYGTATASLMAQLINQIIINQYIMCYTA
jgi:hypothetical protein